MKKSITHIIVVGMLLVVSLLTAQSEVQTGKNVAVTQTNSGKVRGYITNGIFTYKGIPYGTAKRFEAAQKPDAWQGVRSSTMYGPVAPLEVPTTSVRDESEFVFDHDWGFPNEDCLNLNVWTPSIDDGKKRPVMFWIHGGGFTTGSSHELPSYDGENLSKRGDVVVVSINHRLNVLGFLDLSAYGEKYKNSANNSISDLVLSLEWVKDNISNFGGDPNNVTIFGQSGGGAKVNTLMAMPKAKGLFHKAVNQSGSFRTAMLEKEDTQDIAKETISILGLDENTIDSIQNIRFEDLVAASGKALKKVAEKMKAAGKPVIGFGLNWGPSRDGVDLPYQLGSDEALALSKDIPLLLGTAKNEFAPFMNMRFMGASDEAIMEHIKTQYKDKADDYVKAVRKAYPDDTAAKDLLDVDTMFRPGAVAEANAKSALKDGAPVYMYLFTWQSPVFDGKYKALHCMELPFMFDNIALGNQMTGGGQEAHTLAAKMSQSWINFAKTGNPNHADLPEWPAYNVSNTATMHFDNTCQVQPQLDKELFAIVKRN
ncbi:carboxylesterase/lipase family protein [Maribacter sp. 1_2014MBL_MicDiv]|uniref:carboxylesterase/lipase family protein n=1 Tax=Maribacter sp. 1_2014MBL_MicDiv TaxID=1644130 RepID=UPI0008F46D4F|nr:carboxylesterase family protein [Maribacter sp. 1_2014MBL_MicDiv]APA63724.1 carboxylesterase [Maribacter sp. 1_2014MBL_MicDiv]